MNLLVESTALQHNVIDWAPSLLRQKSMVKVEGSPDRINSHISMTKIRFKAGGHHLQFDCGEGWIPPGLLAQDKLGMTEYHFSFQPRYFQELDRCLTAQQPYDHIKLWYSDDDDFLTGIHLTQSEGQVGGNTWDNGLALPFGE